VTHMRVTHMRVTHMAATHMWATHMRVTDMMHSCRPQTHLILCLWTPIRQYLLRTT
jgi:hypothetical protein